MATPVGSASPSIVSRFLDFFTSKEQQYVKELAFLIGCEDGKKKCKDLGQEIFNKAKAAHNGDSLAAKDVVIRICVPFTLTKAIIKEMLVFANNILNVLGME